MRVEVHLLEELGRDGDGVSGLDLVEVEGFVGRRHAAAIVVRQRWRVAFEVVWAVCGFIGEVLQRGEGRVEGWVEVLLVVRGLVVDAARLVSMVVAGVVAVLVTLAVKRGVGVHLTDYGMVLGTQVER